MNPETKFHSLVLGLTVSLMFAALTKLAPYLQQVTVMQVIFGAIAALLVSASIYGLLAKGLVKVLRRFRWLKSKFLGPYYMEGTWVGCFRGHANDLRYFVEVIEQNLSSLTISGKSYTVNDEPHALWNSDAVSMNVEQKELIYTSSIHILSRATTGQSLIYAQLIRKSDESAPHAMEGYAADVEDGIRISISEKKISSKALDFLEALPQAKEIKC